jgi:hypothetical protein
MCRHLLGSEGAGHVRLLTGRGLEFDVCGVGCDRAAQGGSIPELLQACEGCVARCAGDDWDVVAWRGEPEVLTRPEHFDATVVEVPLPVAAADLAPVAAGARPVWLLLAEDGQIGRFDAGSGEWDPLARSTVPAEPDHEAWAGHRVRRRLHGDLLGDFAAVVNDYGHHGQVVDLRSGAVTLSLYGGSHHPETVPFSLAFTRHQGRTVGVHRTDWNRLDVSDAATGELLTSRGPTSYQSGEPRPEHYLDYFHGALHLSPGGQWIADDGWVWQPFGVPNGVGYAQLAPGTCLGIRGRSELALVEPAQRLEYTHVLDRRASAGHQRHWRYLSRVARRLRRHRGPRLTGMCDGVATVRPTRNEDAARA